MRIIVNIIVYTIFISSPVLAQPDDSGFISYYNNGKYKEALQILKKKLSEIYEKRVDLKMLPKDLIPIDSIVEEKDINELFKKRKAKGFFIEDNSELFQLHLYSARCYSKILEYDHSLNHYYEALRFRSLKFENDDAILYEISQIYKRLNLFEPYIRSLEAAYTLNPKRYEYSLELGKALQSTNMKKKAIFHLERYIISKGNDVDDPRLFLLIANLNEDIGKYLETIKYYKRYLNVKENDGYITFALGYLSYKRTGDYKLAIRCFNKCLNLLPEDELYRRSKSFEYKGDIMMKELKFEEAIKMYIETVKYQDRINLEINEKKNEIQELEEQIGGVRSSLLKERKQIYDRYKEYENFREEKGRIELENREKRYELRKLNLGKVRWNLAESFERIGKYEDAIKYYREAISFNYNTNRARQNILKLELIIKRGY